MKRENKMTGGEGLWSDILSQSEIDNLLKQLSEGDLDVDQIQGRTRSRSKL